MAPSNFTQVRAGYEIRQLKKEHLDWVAAIVGHTMSFDSPIWSKTYPDGQTERAYKLAAAIKPSSRNCIESGLSYGVFKSDWAPRYPDTNPWGELRWDTKDLSATREQLLDQMDFPLVSIAMSKDMAAPNPAVSKDHIPWANELEGHSLIRDTLKQGDTSGREKAVKNNGVEGVSVRRSGTHTRGDYSRKGFSKALAHDVMKRMAEKGYREILIHTGSPHVNNVWEHPPAPYTCVVASTFNTTTRQDKFGSAKVNCLRIWVTLVEETPRVARGSG